MSICYLLLAISFVLWIGMAWTSWRVWRHYKRVKKQIDESISKVQEAFGGLGPGGMM